MAIKYTNLAATTLTASAAGGDLTITVNSIAGFPSVTGGTDHFYIQVGGDSGEIMKVTESTTNTWTVVRGQDGTSAIAHSISDAVELRLPRIMIQDLFQDSDLNWVTTGNLSGADLTVGGNATIAGTLGVTGAITGPLAASNLTGTLDDAVVVASNVTQHEASITHQNLSGAGVNTHAAIDSHIASTANPHGVTIAQVSPLTTDGDILIYNTTNTRLPIGTSGQVLAVSVGGIPEWINNPAGFADPLTTRGDLMYKDAANVTNRLPVGGAGEVLISDGTDVSWGTAPGLNDPMTTRGDIIVRDATNTTARLGVGAAGQALVSDGTDISWGAVGDVDGPASATDNAIARYDLTTGKLLQNSGVTIDDSNNIAGVADFGGATATLTGDLIVNSGGAAQINVGEELLEEGSTGLTSGGALSIGTPTTTYDVALGSGHIVDAGASTYTDVSWAAITGTTPAADGVRYILINSGSTITEQATVPTPEERRESVYLGRIVVSGGVVIQAFSEPVVTRQPTNQIYDLAKGLRIFNESGNAVSANGANLSFDKGAGVLFSVGANFHNNPKIPHSVTVGASTPVTFQHLTQTAATGTDVTVISPSNYDVGGTITAIPGSNNQATNMRIYLFPSGNVRVAYGQTIYSTLTNAIQGLAGETFVENSSIAGNGVLICVVAVTKGCTDLSDTTTARFLPVSRFGETSVGGAGASVSSLQNVYDNSVTPEIILDSTRGAVTIQDNSTPLGANLLEVQSNGGGSTYFAVTATEAAVTGNITVTGTVDGRDVATDGSALDNLNTTIGLSALTAAEVDQLENIDTVTITNTQWGYLGATDQGVATTNNVTFNDVTVSGNLTVSGTTTTIDTATLTVEDHNIELGSVTTPTDVTADGGGITLKGATDKTILWDNANDNWTSSEHWNLATGKTFKINNVSVLSSTTLGSNITASSLTSVGTLNSLTATGVIRGSSFVDVGYVDSSNTGRLNYGVTNGLEINSFIGGAYDDVSVNTGGGKFGVGTNTPEQKFHIESNGNTGTYGLLRNTDTGTTAFASFNVQNGSDLNDGVQLVATGSAFTTNGAFVQDSGLLDARPNLSGGLSIVTRHSSGVMRFYTGGSATSNERMRIDASGNVGIGTSSPQFNVDIKTATDRHVAVFDNAGGSTILGSTDAGASTSLRLAGFPLLFTGNGGAGAEHMRLDSSGNFGINDASPGSKLCVAVSNNSNIPVATFTQNDNTNNPTAVYIDNNGSGTPLLIESNGDSFSVMRTGSASGDSGFTFENSGDANNSWRMYRHNGGTFRIASAPLQPFGGSQTAAITCDTSGNVGIHNETSPDTALHVTGSGVEVKIEDSVATGSPKLSFYQTTSERAYIQYEDTGDNLLLDSDGSMEFSTNNSATLTLSATKRATFKGFVNTDADTELTISAGVITATKSFHSVDTEADAATDDLDTINGGSIGDILVIRPDVSGRTIVAKDGTGNLRLAGDFSMDDSADVLTLIFNGSNWMEISRSNNA